MALVKNKTLFFIALILVLQSCATYHPKPLDQAAVRRALAPPDLESIRIRAREIRHPMLKPVDIDFKKGLSADDVAIMAVIANPGLRVLRDQNGIAAAQLLQAGILPNPTFTYSLDVPTGGNSQGAFNAYGLTLDWDIKSLLTRGARVSSARAQAASVRLDIAWKEWQVAERAKEHVFSCIFLQKQLSVARGEEKRLRVNLDEIKKAVDLGDMTVIDLDAADAALRRIHSSVLDIKKRLEEERLALNRTAGFPPEAVLPLQKGITAPSMKALPTVEEIMNGIEARRLDLLAFRMGYQSQEERLRAAVRAQFPAINIGLTHLRDTSDVVTTGFAVAISLPFFDRNQGRIAIERASRRQLYDEYMDRLFQTRADAAGILAGIRSLGKQADAAKKAVRSLKKLVQASHNGLLEGNIDVLSYYNELDRLTAKQLEVLKLQQGLADLNIALEITAGRYLGHS